MKQLIIIWIVIWNYSFILSAQSPASEERRVTIESEGWKLIGDLMLPRIKEGPVPVVLMLNKAAGDRTVYKDMAIHLASRGIASLRLDLRGHGESINLGAFKPGEVPRDPKIWDSERDVIAACRFLRSQKDIDGTIMGMVGSSYSGEEMAEAGRLDGYVQAYVALSPGSFSDESIAGIDSSGVHWLFITSRDEPHLQEIRKEVQQLSKTVEMIIVPGKNHATRLLNDFSDLAERIAVWLTWHLK